jgi:hypothetical protein
MLARSNLLLELVTMSVFKADIKQSRSRGPQTSIVGFGNPRNPAKKAVPRAGGPLRTGPKPPAELSKLKQVRPWHGRGRRILADSIIKSGGASLLADHHDDG